MENIPKYDFNEFYLIDVTNGKKDELIVNYDINFDSYVNGVYENSFFIFDNSFFLYRDTLIFGL